MGNDYEVDKELKDAARRSADKIAESDFFMVLFNDAMVEEVLPLIQMGLAMYMDKPIFLLVPEGAAIPENLRKVAQGIETYRRTPDDVSSIERATERLIGRIKPS